MYSCSTLVSYSEVGVAPPLRLQSYGGASWILLAHLFLEALHSIHLAWLSGRSVEQLFA